MQASAAPSQTAEEAAVRAAVQSFVDAWNRHDLEAFAALFTEDADFVNVRGTRWIGRSAIREGHAATHATIFKNSQLRILELSVRFLKPDVAVARWPASSLARPHRRVRVCRLARPFPPS
jgi:uncharacterized protein (TIGR02246 family)